MLFYVIVMRGDIMKYTVKKQMQLLEFLMIHTNRKNSKLYLKHQQVYVNGSNQVKFDTMLEIGDVVEISKERSSSDLEILYEDNDCVIINKPSGLLSMSNGNQNEKTAYQLVGQYVKSQNKNNRIFIVHRLDRDTSGILLFAKNEKMKQLLQNDWNNLVIKRGYLTLVEGVVERKSGTIKNYLDESKTQQVYITKNGGKLAVTHYKVVKQNRNNTLLEVYLDTGRKNQIRVHMEYLKHSIVGDKKYGATTNPIKRLGLHCHDFEFKHPISKKVIAVKKDAPEVFYKLFK